MDVACFLIIVLLISVCVFLSALVYTVVVLYHSEGDFEVMFHVVLVIIVKLVIEDVMCMDVNEYLWLFMMQTG